MKVPGLILGLLLTWFAQAQQQYYGTRLSNLALSGSNSQTDLQVLPIKVGDTLTPESLRASIKALYDTGHYSYVEASAEKTADGSTSLTFNVRPIFFFSTFRLDSDDLLDRPLASYLRLPFGEKFTTSAVERVVQDTTTLLVSEGYFQAKITPSYEYDDQNHLVFVTLKVDSAPKAIVGQIQIKGGEETFTPKELSDAFGVKPGDDFSASKVDKGISDLRAKFAELRFLNTSVVTDRKYNPSTNTVDLDVRAQPGQFALVQTRGFEISDKKLQDLVPIYEEAAVDPDLVEEGRVRLTRYMQQEGYFDAQVAAEIIEVDPTLGNAIQINYIIAPGAKHEIVDVRIDGNQFFTTDEIRKRIKTRKGELFKRGVFSADVLDADRQTIEAMYRNAGFQGTVVTARPEDVDHSITVLIHIDEGKQLHVSSIEFVGNSIPTAELLNAITLKQGDTFTVAVADQARAALTQFYYSRGYADVRVERSTELAGDGVRVIFNITEGESFLIGMIFVEGNTRTQPKVVRRNSGLHEYTPFDPETVLVAQQRLYATGLFSRVEIVTLDEGLKGVRNVLIQVEDARPILLTYGVGYQELERVRGTFEISHNNLFGQQRSISFRVRGSSRERLAQATYQEPRLFNHELDGFASTFIEHTDRPAFKANRIDFSLQVLKRLSTKSNVSIASSYQTVNISDVRTNPHAENDPSQIGPCHICQIGRISTSVISDHRNDAVNPSGGSFRSLVFQVANKVLGSELNFTSLYNQSVFYFPAAHGGTLATAFRFGWSHPYGKTAEFAPGQAQQLPPTERFFAGGSATLRGFGLEDAAPPATPNLEGGNAMTIGNVEYRVPLRRFPVRDVWGALFYDTGNVFPQITDIRLSQFTHSVGFGFRYFTPVGPARLDFGFNLRPTINPDGSPQPRMKVFFTLGNPF